MKSASPSIALPVSLADWIVTPSIDFIKLTSAFLADLEALRLALGTPTTAFVHAGRNSADRNTITLHDPSVAQLQTVIDHAPRMQIYEIEFTLDFRPKGGPADLDELAPVFRWFADCLRPSDDVALAKRRNFDEPARRYVEVPPGPSHSMTTYVWRNRLERVRQRLYMKVEDNGMPVPFPSVRLEATLNMIACWHVGLEYAFQLVDFSRNARRVLSPHFQIAAGIKPRLTRSRAAVGTHLREQADAFNRRESARAVRVWRTKGAMGASKLGLETIPDKGAHKRIGDALDRLRPRLATLKLPEISRANATPEQIKTLDFIEEHRLSALPSIGVKKYEHLTFRKEPRRKEES